MLRHSELTAYNNRFGSEKGIIYTKVTETNELGNACAVIARISRRFSADIRPAGFSLLPSGRRTRGPISPRGDAHTAVGFHVKISSDVHISPGPWDGRNRSTTNLRPWSNRDGAEQSTVRSSAPRRVVHPAKIARNWRPVIEKLTSNAEL